MPSIYQIPFTNIEGVPMMAQIVDTYGLHPKTYSAYKYNTDYPAPGKINLDTGAGGQSFTPNGTFTDFTFNGTDHVGDIRIEMQVFAPIIVGVQVLINGTPYTSFVAPDATLQTVNITRTFVDGDVLSISLQHAAYVMQASFFASMGEINPVAFLQGSGEPVTLSVIDNDENKFTPIRAKQLVIQFLSTNNVNLSNFAGEQGDDQYKVTFFTVTPFAPIFEGHLVLDDSSQDFLHNDTRRVITLTATDNIGLLKDIALTKPDGTNPRGKFKIIEFISWCLKKTNLTLPINVMNNLYEETLQGIPAYNSIYLDAKTFEDEIGSCIDCYEVLRTIFAEECFITQWAGAWWVRRIDEYEGNVNFYDNYNADGGYQGTTSSVIFRKNIGIADPITLVMPPSRVILNRPNSFIKETFDYEYPREIIDNIDFSRSDTPYLTGTPYVDVDGVTKVKKRYHLEDWLIGRYSANNPTSPLLSTVFPYIERIFKNDYEIERYIVVPPSAEASPFAYLRCNPISVDEKDRINISVDFRHGSLDPGNNVNPMAIILKGDNGTNYYALQGTGQWFNAVSFGTAFFFSTAFVYTNDDAKTTWQTVTVNLKDIPTKGELFVFLDAGSIGIDNHYQNLRFEYLPFINGSYTKYKGQSNTIKQTGNFLSIKDDKIFISDSPKKLFKGAMFKLVAGKYQLAERFYNGAVPGIRANPLEEHYHRLDHIMAYDKWNQYRRLMRIFDCSLFGLETNTQIPDVLHTFFIQDSSPHTDSKHFILLHYTMNFYRCLWTGTFAEVYDEIKTKDYATDLQFKYIENR